MPELPNEEQGQKEPVIDNTGDDLPPENPNLVGQVSRFKVRIPRPANPDPAPDADDNSNSNAPAP